MKKAISCFLLLCLFSTSAIAQKSQDTTYEWGIDKVEKILNFSHDANIDQHLNSLSPYFTQKGFENFKTALKQSRLYEAHQEKAVDLAAIYDKTSIVEHPVQQGGDDVIVYVPVVITKAAHSYKGSYLIKLILKEEAEDLKIHQFLMGAEYTSLECDQHHLKTHEIVKKKLEDMNAIQRWWFLQQAESDKNKVLELLNEEEKELLKNSPCN